MEGFVPAHFNVDSERRLVTMRFDSEVTVQDVVQYLESLKANPAFEPDFSELVDLTQVMSSEVDFQAAMMLAHKVSVFAGSETSFCGTQSSNLQDNTHVPDGTWGRRRHRSFSYHGRSQAMVRY